MLFVVTPVTIAEQVLPLLQSYMGIQIGSSSQKSGFGTSSGPNSESKTSWLPSISSWLPSFTSSTTDSTSNTRVNGFTSHNLSGPFTDVALSNFYSSIGMSPISEATMTQQNTVPIWKILAAFLKKNCFFLELKTLYLEGFFEQAASSSISSNLTPPLNKALNFAN